MNDLKILIIGGGIAGLTAAIALRRKGFTADIIEKDPDWAVYGVGIIQQSNVVRAVSQLGILDDYLDAGFGFDHVEIYRPDGERIARIPSPKLADGYPANVGIGRPALHKVLGSKAMEAGATIKLGVTATEITQSSDRVFVTFSDGTNGEYDIVIGADGLYSDTRKKLFPEAMTPEFTGQAVWRYNFPRPDDLDCLQAYEGRIGIGLVPLSDDLMYVYVTTPEPGNPWYEKKGIAAAMREKLADSPSKKIQELAVQITEDDGVVYKPLEWHMLTGDWHAGRVALIGDAVHGTTPHLGQGAGMAIEDSLVIAEELSQAKSPEDAFVAFRKRRYERCEFIVESSKAICFGQLGKGPEANQGEMTMKMFEVTAQPI